MPNVIPFRDTPKVADSVLFNKEDIKEGIILTYYGRLNPGSQWGVSKIFTYYKDWVCVNGVWKQEMRHRRVKECTKYFDLVFLRRLTPTHRDNRMSSRMELNFGYLAYSAIWRLS